MTATDELRKMLEEQGVEYEAECIDFSNYFTWGENDCYSYTEYQDGTVLRIWDCTPEQAIAATLGTSERTCHIEERYIDWYCDACFEMVGTCDTTSELFIEGNAIKLWNYCPNCGARVERQSK